jgi:chromosome segregation protein
MRIAKLSISGFRGVLSPLHLDFPTGFVVLSGRNGAGKSSVCDAIEFALTGTITKYARESEKGEGVADYLWWRGNSPAADRYVTLTLINDTGQEWTITRRPEGTDEAVLKDLLAHVCLQAIDPTKGFSDVCTTSIIRDEMITQLSVDLAETDRFAFVRAAVGSASFSATEKKLKDISEVAQRRSAHATRDYDSARNRVRDLVSEISRLRSETSENKDVQNSEVFLRLAIGSPVADASGLLTEARKLATDIRLKIDAATRYLDKLHAHQARMEQQNVAELAQRQQTLTESISSLRLAVAGEQAQLSQLEQTIAVSGNTPTGQSSLAQLQAHGSTTGLIDGRCPLCGSSISENAFRTHLEEIDRALQGAAALAAQLESQRTSLQAEERRHSAELAEALRQFDQVSATIAGFEQQNIRLREEAEGLSFTGGMSAEEVKVWVEDNRRKLSQIDRSIAVLESSRLLGRVAEVEQDLTAMQKTAVEAERQLELVKAAERRVKDASATLKRVASEQIDERLASISPLLSELYVRLRPHVDWPQINYLIRGDVRRFLSLRVGDGEGHNLRFMFSSGQRRAVGLAFLLSICLSRPWCALRSVLLDDPVQHIDDYRALHLVEALAAVRQSDFQVICTVEDQELGGLLARRLRSTSDSPGTLIELQYTSGSGVLLERTTPINPFPFEILRSA